MNYLYLIVVEIEPRFMRNCIYHNTVNVITYPCPYLSWTILVMTASISLRGVNRVCALLYFVAVCYPGGKVYGANMGPTWGRQDPGGPHVGPMNLAIWVAFDTHILYLLLWHCFSTSTRVTGPWGIRVNKCIDSTMKRPQSHNKTVYIPWDVMCTLCTV